MASEREMVVWKVVAGILVALLMLSTSTCAFLLGRLEEADCPWGASCDGGEVHGSGYADD